MHRESYDLTKTPSEASKDFAHLLGSLATPVGVLEEKERARAEQMLHELPAAFQKAISVEGEPEREGILSGIRDHLTELERLLAGQKMMFQASALAMRVAARHLTANLTAVFEELLDICDSVNSLIEGDSMRQMGIKPRPKAPSKAKKAPKTYAKAQDEILDALKKKGWTVVAHLKVPHATAPDGEFRFWFKPQAIYASTGITVKNFGDARSVFARDYRFGDIGEFVSGLEKYAERHSAA